MELPGLRAFFDLAGQEPDQHLAMTQAADALAPTPPPPGEHRERASQLAESLIAWTNVRPDTPARENLAAALETIITLGTHTAHDSVLDLYLQAADQIAKSEIADLDDDVSTEALVAQMVVGQVVFERLLVSLRRLAEEHHSAVRFKHE